MSDVASQLTFRRFLDTSPRLYTVDIIETNILIQAKHSEMLNVLSGISVKPTHSIKYPKRVTNTKCIVSCVHSGYW